MGDIKYSELTSRNGYFIDEKLQKKISETTLVFIGCGLASNVAESAARIGFTSFVLVDGDNVELNNLNRQNFYYKDIGKNKAKATEQKIKEVNPGAKITLFQKFVSEEDVEKIISMGDIIINSADFNKVTYSIDEKSSNQGKISISPLNIGFGSIVTAFGPDSTRLIEMTKGVAKNDKQYLLRFYQSLSAYKLPKYISKKIANIFTFIVKKGFFPQNIIAAHTSSALILEIIIKYLKTGKIKMAPCAYHCDMEELND